jgi:hypothetical protein
MGQLACKLLIFYCKTRNEGKTPGPLCELPVIFRVSLILLLMRLLEV